MSNSSGDQEGVILRNFNFKKTLSPGSCEKALYQKLSTYDDGADPVEKRSNALAWLTDTQALINSVIEDIYDIQHGVSNEVRGITPSSVERTDILVEEARLKVLHEIGWNHRGSFHDNIHAAAYPELYYYIRTARTANRLWYMPHYGIMGGDVADERSNRRPAIGSYTYVSTLEDAIDFILNELHMVGRPTLVDHYHRNELAAAESKRGRPFQTNKERNEQIAKQAKQINDRVNRILSEDSITREIEVIRRCADIMPLPDLISRYFINQANISLNKAKKHAREQSKSRVLSDTPAVDLDSIPTKGRGDGNPLTPLHPVHNPSTSIPRGGLVLPSPSNKAHRKMSDPEVTDLDKKPESNDIGEETKALIAGPSNSLEDKVEDAPQVDKSEDASKVEDQELKTAEENASSGPSRDYALPRPIAMPGVVAPATVPESSDKDSSEKDPVEEKAQDSAVPAEADESHAVSSEDTDHPDLPEAVSLDEKSDTAKKAAGGAGLLAAGAAGGWWASRKKKDKASAVEDSTDETAATENPDASAEVDADQVMDDDQSVVAGDSASTDVDVDAVDADVDAVDAEADDVDAVDADVDAVDADVDAVDAEADDVDAVDADVDAVDAEADDVDAVDADVDVDAVDADVDVDAVDADVDVDAVDADVDVDVDAEADDVDAEADDVDAEADDVDAETDDVDAVDADAVDADVDAVDADAVDAETDDAETDDVDAVDAEIDSAADDSEDDADIDSESAPETHVENDSDDQIDESDDSADIEDPVDSESDDKGVAEKIADAATVTGAVVAAGAAAAAGAVGLTSDDDADDDDDHIDDSDDSIADSDDDIVDSDDDIVDSDDSDVDDSDVEKDAEVKAQLSGALRSLELKRIAEYDADDEFSLNSFESEGGAIISDIESDPTDELDELDENEESDEDQLDQADALDDFLNDTEDSDEAEAVDADAEAEESHPDAELDSFLDEVAPVSEDVSDTEETEEDPDPEAELDDFLNEVQPVEDEVNEDEVSEEDEVNEDEVSEEEDTTTDTDAELDSFLDEVAPEPDTEADLDDFMDTFEDHESDNEEQEVSPSEVLRQVVPELFDRSRMPISDAPGEKIDKDMDDFLKDY